VIITTNAAMRSDEVFIASIVQLFSPIIRPCNYKQFVAAWQ
jgi:hypothetical protein